MPRMPKGTVTFLFTDIEGSTRLWEQHPRAMQAALARHDTLLRETIESNGGYIFKTMGDAFCAAFPTAPEALQAAIAAQRTVQAADWEATGVGPIKVRIALHTGAAEVRDKDYFGLPLNRVSRLLSAGYGGQVLLSLPTQQLVRDLMPSDADLKDLGECDLRDLTRPEHIYQLLAPDLPSDFPGLKVVSTRHQPGDGAAVLDRDTQAVTVQTAQGAQDKTTPELRNPYKGLRAFQEADAGDFFGRETLTERLLTRMNEEGPLNHFLAVVGPSGSGKSSVVRAGLVPALRQGGAPGSERWLIVEMLPGAHPLEELEALLLNIAVNPPESLIHQLSENERGLVRAVKRILPRDETIELALVIDQFEEVFTLVEDEPVRVHFLESLYAAVTEPRSRLRVIVTLRADFFDRPLLYPDPGELMRQRTAVVLPLAADELERAIVRPAESVGVTLEPELVATIIKDVGEQPGTLPLLQYALTELFERRAGNTMTLAAYRESGGVLGALARRADELYEGLSDLEREATRQLFLRLVTLGEGVEDTRRRVRIQELASLTSIEVGEAETEAPTTHPSNPAPNIPHSPFRIPHSLDRVLDLFGRYRLLTFDRDPITKGPTVEVAHEALIRTWSRLREWLDAGRSDLRVQRQMMAAAGEWAEAGHDPSFLATGARLAQFEALAEGATRPEGVALTVEEREYLSASVGERERQERAEQERQAHELELAHRSEKAQRSAANRLKVLVAGMGIFLALALILSGWAVNRSQAADDNAKRAESSAATAVADFTRADAQRLAAEAIGLLPAKNNPELIALLSIRSMLTQYSLQGDIALIGATALEYPRQVFAGHSDFITDGEYSPDGKYVLTASWDKTARLWDAQTGRELRRFTGHTDWVWDAAFSPDGKYVLTSSRDKTARLWNAQTGQELRTLSGHTDAVRGVAFSPEGRYAFTNSVDKTVRLWDVSTGQELRVFSGPDRMYRVAVSPDGKYVLSGSLDNTARLWDTQTGQELRTFSGHTDMVWGVAFSPDGKYVLTGGYDKTARLWDAQTGQELRRFTGHTEFVGNVAFSPDGKYALTGSGDFTARLWDVQTGVQLRVYSGYRNSVGSVAFSPDGKYILTSDDEARLWEIQPQPLAPQFIGHTDDLVNVAFSPDGKYVLTSSHDKTARLWDAQTGKELRVFSGHTDIVQDVVFSPNGKYVLTGSSDKTSRMWDSQTGQELRRFIDHANAINGVAFSPDGKYVLTGSGDKTARLWNAQTGKELLSLTGHTSGVEDVAFSPDGKYVLTGSGDKTARLWNAQTGQELRTFSGHTEEVFHIAFSPDGKYVLTSSKDKTARLWDAQIGKELRIFTGRSDIVNGLAFSPDGKHALIGSNDRTARLWDVQTGQEVRRFTGHTEYVEDVAFSPDGKYVLTGSGDDTARLWNTDYHDVIRYLCGKLLRDFTDEEREQYGIKDNEPTCPK